MMNIKSYGMVALTRSTSYACDTLVLEPLVFIAKL
jgi:hypothetical protein